MPSDHWLVTTPVSEPSVATAIANGVSHSDPALNPSWTAPGMSTIPSAFVAPDHFCAPVLSSSVTVALGTDLPVLSSVTQAIDFEGPNLKWVARLVSWTITRNPLRGRHSRFGEFTSTSTSPVLAPPRT